MYIQGFPTNHGKRYRPCLVRMISLGRRNTGAEEGIELPKSGPRRLGKWLGEDTQVPWKPGGMISVIGSIHSTRFNKSFPIPKWRPLDDLMMWISCGTKTWPFTVISYISARSAGLGGSGSRGRISGLDEVWCRSQAPRRWITSCRAWQGRSTWMSGSTEKFRASQGPVLGEKLRMRMRMCFFHPDKE